MEIKAVLKKDVQAFENVRYRTAYDLLASRGIRAFDKKIILEYFSITGADSEIIKQIKDNPLSAILFGTA